jgi:ABC-type Fe3+ transport system substrate-binding protein
VSRLLAAARAAGETELSLAWSNNTLRGSEGAARWEALFNRLYGTSIRINFTPGPSMTEMAGKVSQEVATGRKASTDVLLGAESHYGALIDVDVLESYDYTQLSPRITPEIVAPRNRGVEVTSRLPGISYNSDLVPPADVPRVLEDTLHPRWRGRIASTVNAASFDRVASRPEWGPERMTAYVSRLSENIAGLTRCGELPRIMSGEFAMLVMDCGSYDANRLRAEGAPLAHVIPEDAATVLFFYMGVPRTAPHPNLAKLYVNMWLTEEGQRLYYEIEWSDHYALPGSRSATELAGLRAKGGEPLRMDARFVNERPDTIKLGDDLAKILREKR